MLDSRLSFEMLWLAVFWVLLVSPCGGAVRSRSRWFAAQVSVSVIVHSCCCFFFLVFAQVRADFIYSA